VDIEAAEAANNRSKAAQLKKDKFAELVKKLRAKTKTARKTLVGGWRLLGWTAPALLAHVMPLLLPHADIADAAAACSHAHGLIHYHSTTGHMSLTLLPARLLPARRQAIRQGGD
jgi:hypothetical protein